MDLDLNAGFDSRWMRFQKRDALSELVLKTDCTIRQKGTRALGATPEDRRILDSLLKNFLCSYASIDDLVKDSSILADEMPHDRYKLSRAYATYMATKGICNQLNTEFIERIRSTQEPAVQLFESDVNQPSEYSFLMRILPKLSSHGEGSKIDVLKYTYFSFFKRLHEVTGSYLAVNCKESTKEKFRNIKVYKTGLDFKQLAEIRKADPQKKIGVTPSGDEDLPQELPLYEFYPHARLDRVIGNREPLEAIYASIIRAAKYDPQSGKNPFSQNGFRFKDAFMLHGEPGVGKTFMLHALFNRSVELGKRYGIEYVVCDLGKGIKSKWINRGAAVFERYIDLQRNSDKVYLNIIDEADGIFPVNERGELHPETQKILREMKTAINMNVKGNAVYYFLTNYPERFEGALKQRFTPLYIPGPTSPEEFTEVYRQELGMFGNDIPDRQLFDVGKRTADYKSFFKSEGLKIYVTGRTVRQISSYFVDSDDRKLIANEDIMMPASPSQVSAYIPQLCVPLTYHSLSNQLEKHIDDLRRSEQPHM